MPRTQLLKEVLELKGTNYLLELATGSGKSRLAIEKTKTLTTDKVLIVIPRVILEESWRKEWDRWGKDYEGELMYTSYKSFPTLEQKNFNVVIFDECHHLSERCIDALDSYTIEHSILLSATITNSMKRIFTEKFNDLVMYERDIREMIHKGIIPDPIVYLIPLHLNQGPPTEVIYKNKNAKGRLLETNWVNRWAYLKQKQCKVKIYCNQAQYHLDLNNSIDYWKKQYNKTKLNSAKNTWLKLCGNRLKWLSEKKEPLIRSILLSLEPYRTLTFCSGIEQSERLGKYCITSKDKKQSEDYLARFNNKEINHITSCNMLNEGMNLKDCQIGIYANLNSSETIIKQRTGRILRHTNPFIIIPYYKETREEELIETMMENYNPELVRVVNNIKNIIIDEA